jgi:tRNA(Ile2) C34 agmatinyltransferase TiaS
MAELVAYVCSRCGARLEAMGRAQVTCRCGASMRPAARDPRQDTRQGDATQPARNPTVSELVQRSIFDAVEDS